MNTHTPGPWEQAHRKGADGMFNTEVFSAQHGLIATCAWTPKPTVNGVTETYRTDNARLIAAAPDLLVALIDLRRRFAGINHLDFIADWLAEADAAIARATGDALARFTQRRSIVR